MKNHIRANWKRYALAIGAAVAAYYGVDGSKVQAALSILLSLVGG